MSHHTQDIHEWAAKSVATMLQRVLKLVASEYMRRVQELRQ